MKQLMKISLGIYLALVSVFVATNVPVRNMPVNQSIAVSAAMDEGQCQISADENFPDLFSETACRTISANNVTHLFSRVVSSSGSFAYMKFALPDKADFHAISIKQPYVRECNILGTVKPKILHYIYNLHRIRV